MTDDAPEFEAPEEDDITTGDHHRWYQSGKLYVTGSLRKVMKQMDKDKFWPNVWFISDHGNAHLIVPSDEDDDDDDEDEDEDDEDEDEED